METTENPTTTARVTTTSAPVKARRKAEASAEALANAPTKPRLSKREKEALAAREEQSTIGRSLSASMVTLTRVLGRKAGGTPTDVLSSLIRAANTLIGATPEQRRGASIPIAHPNPDRAAVGETVTVSVEEALVMVFATSNVIARINRANPAK